MRLQDAIADVKSKGGRLRNSHWGPSDPSFLLFVPGRVVKASFEPVVAALGEGVEFVVEDHIDAFWVTVQGDTVVCAACHVGYVFSQIEILSDVWEIV
jgi:hypothetical protein